MFYDVAMNFVIGTILMVVGAIMICIPNRVFTWILVVSILFLFANGVTLFIRFIKNKDTFNKLGYKTKINTHTTSCINLFLDIYLYSEYRLIYC